MQSSEHPRVQYSFVVDEQPHFAYQGWHLAHSITQLCHASHQDIHVHFTPEVPQEVCYEFVKAGFSTHALSRFGDGKYCNKIVQLRSLRATESDIVLLLDTDMIALADIRPCLSTTFLVGKAVDAANPPLSVLEEIAAAASLTPTPRCTTDTGDGETFAGNFNGGFYSIPSRFSESISTEWERWATWLIQNIEPLRRCRKEAHVDQVAFWMSLASLQLPFSLGPSNLNYFVHMAAPHHYYDPDRPIALLHYHNSSLNVLGKLEPPCTLTSIEQDAVRAANKQIGANFNNALFWSYRYSCWPERGSGVGSRGENLRYKQALLRAEGIETARSVLDVGCGDLEVLRGLTLQRYIGVDISPVAVERARSLMPFASIWLGIQEDVPTAELVICFEVLIHQPDEASYNDLIRFISKRAERTLIVSGYERSTEAIAANPMVFFHEPLEKSLSDTGLFSKIEKVGGHTDVAIFRCEK